ncbi:hypothetical protein RB594_008071 [Gaeumannomyces avenae]
MAPSAVFHSLGDADYAATATSKNDAVFKSGDPECALAEISDPEVTRPPAFGDPYEARGYLKHRLAIACRIFAQFGFAEGIAGHITLRDPVDPTSFWVNPFGLHFSQIRDEDLILVNESGCVIDGGRNRRLNHAAYAIHAELHRARPDVNCAAHAHTMHGRAICSRARPGLRMLTQDFCVFWRDLALHPSFAGVVLAADEGRAIASALGGRKAALLASHGLLVAGASVEATVAWFVLLERCCQVQLLAEAAAAGQGGGADTAVFEIGDEEARATWEVMGSPEHGYLMGLPLFQVAEREFGEETYLGRGLEKR